MCAMMPIFRVFPRGDCLAIYVEISEVRSQISDLPAVMGEGLVGFGHAMRVFALFHRATAKVGSVEQLVGQLLLHRLAVAARRGVADDPADAQGEAAIR